MTGLHAWLKESGALVNALSAFGQPGVCTFNQGNIDGCEQVEYDDSNWRKVMGKGAPIPGISTDSVLVEGEGHDLPLCDWSMTDGPAAMRKRILLPQAIEGLPTAGSKVFVTLTMLAPLEVYVDGKCVANYRYWGDTRACELTVAESYQVGREHIVVFRTPQNDGDAHLGVYFNTSVVEDALLRLSTANAQLNFAQLLCEKYGAQDPALREALHKLADRLDAGAVLRRDWTAIDHAAGEIDSALQPFAPYAKQYRVHLIAHAHIDCNWLWDYEDTVDISLRDFKTVCDIMDENPDLRFSQSQTAIYDIIRQKDPALFERVKEKIAQGKWDITAATWTEHDLNLSGGEVFARQALLANRFVVGELNGKPSEICWEPDTFGHPGTVPNLLSKCGVKYYYQFRCGTGDPVYWWEGTDGSRVLTFCYGPYNNALRPNNLMPVVHAFETSYGMKNAMFVYGVGDHGGGPTRNDIAIKRYLDTKPALPELVFSTAHDFYDAALAEKCDFPVYKGERNFIFEGCYTTKAKIKKYLRDGEARLLEAEAMLAAASMTGSADIGTEKKEVAEAWKHVCFNGFHDISCGCNIHAGDKHDFAIGRAAIETGKNVVRKLLQSQIAADADRFELSVFNPLGWARDDVVTLDLPEGCEGGKLFDADGAEQRVQFENRQLCFVAKNVPALGGKVYTLVPGEVCGAKPVSVRMRKGSTDGSVCTMESDRYVLDVSARSGSIVRLYDKRKRCDVLRPLKGQDEVPYAFKGELSGARLEMRQEEPHIMSAWIMGNIAQRERLLCAESIECISVGPVKASLRVTHRHGESRFAQVMTIYHELPRIDFQFDGDWQERGHYSTGVPNLRVGFTSTFANPRMFFEAPMGYVERDRMGCEVPALRYVHLQQGDAGLSLLNDNKFGFAVEGPSVYMSLVRASYSPDALPDVGAIDARYALLPGDTLDMAGTTRAAAGFNHPLMSVWGAWPQREALVETDNEQVVISCVKPANDGDGIVVRLVEYAGKPASVRIALPGEWTRVWETDMLERPVRLLTALENQTQIGLTAFENKTILFER